MRVVIQVVSNSQVIVDNEIVGKIDKGMNILVCLEVDDTLETLKKASEKILNLRLFPSQKRPQGHDANIVDFGGEILAISQFTLSWRGQKGNRPSYDASMGPEKAKEYFDIFCQHLQNKVPVETGKFGAMMEISIVNTGPTTYILEF